MMASGAATSESLVSLYLKRIDDIDRGGPRLNAIIQTNPDALAIARDLDRERREKGPRGPLHGIPVVIKDNIDTADKHGDDRRLARPPRLEARPRRFRRRPPPGRRGGHHRQDEPQRVGQLPLLPLDERLERPRRADAQPLRPRPEPVRVELGLGRGRLGQPGRGGRRHGDRRLHRLAVFVLRPRRHQADGRARQPLGHRPDRPFPGHGRADGPHGRRRGDAPRRDDRGRPGRPRDQGERRPGPHRLPRIPQARRAPRRADRRPAGGLLRLQPEARPHSPGGCRGA